MPLHITYRPQALQEVFGNDSVKASVQTILAREDRPRAWLFTGQSGTGKTTMARIIASAYGCYDPDKPMAEQRDYEEKNIADARGIDDARRLINTMSYLPQEGAFRVFTLDEIQQATKDFQQALLKALEDTPSHVVFILCTTDPDRLLKTIRTRCTTFEMRPLTGPVMRQLLAHVLEQERLTDFPQDVVEAIVANSDGSARQALNLLDKVIDIPDNGEMLRAVQQTMGLEATVRELCQALLEKKGWAIVAKIFAGLPEGEEAEGIRRKVLGYMAKVVSGKEDKQAFTVIQCFKDNCYDSGMAGLMLMAFRCLF